MNVDAGQRTYLSMSHQSTDGVSGNLLCHRANGRPASAQEMAAPTFVEDAMRRHGSADQLPEWRSALLIEPR